MAIFLGWDVVIRCTLANFRRRFRNRVSALVQMSMFDQLVRVLGAQVGSQSVDTTIGGRTVRTHGTLGGMRVIVVPTICHFLPAWPATPHRARISRWREHVVIWHCVVATSVTASSSSSCTAAAGSYAATAMQRMMVVVIGGQRIVMRW